MRELLGGFAALVLGLVVVVALAVGGYSLYWHVAKQNVRNQYDVNTNTQQYQAGLISEERNLSLEWTRAEDPGQKQAIADQFCQVYPNLTPAPADLVTAHAGMCS